jgi:hypothetical protein
VRSNIGKEKEKRLIHNNNEWINKEDILDKLNDNICLTKNKMNKRIIDLQTYINELEENKVNINKLFLELKVTGVIFLQYIF